MWWRRTFGNRNKSRSCPVRGTTDRVAQRVGRRQLQLEPLEERTLLSVTMNPETHYEPFAPVLVQESIPAEGSRFEPLGQPSSYDLRDVGPSHDNYVTPVKNQGSCGSCWVFATYASLESSILVEGGSTRDLSENHLKNYHGFDYGPCDGGHSYMSEAYLSRWSGPVDESDDPYHDYDDRPSPGGAAQYYVRESLWFDTDQEMKDAIMTYGALYTGMYIDNDYYNPIDYTYWYDGGDFNHAVTIVGWDDNQVVTGGGSSPGGTTTGAWLIKNSWGTSWGNNGYFWIAYADTMGANWGVSFNDAVDPSTFGTVYRHDEFGDVAELNTPYGFNAFVATADEDLTAIQFWTQADNASYDIRVYDTYSGGSLSGQLASVTGTCTYAGYHTADLPSPVALTTSDDFFVYLGITNGGPYPLAIDYAYSGYSSASTANPGESYYSFDGTSWTDLTTWDATANFSIKALTSPAAPGPGDTSLDVVSGDLVITDVNGGDTDDDLTLTYDAGDVVVTDPSHILTTSIPGASGSGTNQIRIPGSAITGGIILDTLAGDDTVTIDHGAGAMLPFDITYDGGAHTAGDSLVTTGNPGSGFTETYSVGPGDDEGTIVTSDGSSTQTLTFSNLEPIDSLAQTNFVVNATDAANNIDVLNGTAGRVLVQVDGFEAVEFANKTNVTINAGNGVAGGDSYDTISVDFTNLAPGLQTLTINGDEDDDWIWVANLPGGLTSVALNGQDGDDGFEFFDALDTLDGILSPVAITGGEGGETGGDWVRLWDYGAAAADPLITVTNSTVTGIAPQPITYSEVEDLLVDAQDADASTILVESTAAGTDTEIDGGGAGDFILVGNAGTLDDILGPLTITDYYGGGAGDMVVYDDMNDTDPNTYSLASDGDLTRTGIPLIDLTGGGSEFFEIVALGASTAANSVSVTPSADTEFWLDGNTPTTPLPADTLTVDLSGVTGPLLELIPTALGGGGQYSFASGELPVYFMNFETVNATGGVYDLVIREDLSDDANLVPYGFPSGSGFADDMQDDYIEVMLDDSGTWLDVAVNSVPQFSAVAASVNSLEVIGSTDSDTLIINESTGGLPSFAGDLAAGGGVSTTAHANGAFLAGSTPGNVGIHFDGGGTPGTDGLALQFLTGQDVAYYSDDMTTANSGNVSVAGAFSMSFSDLAPMAFLGGGPMSTLTLDATATPATSFLNIDDDSNAPGPLVWASGLGNGVTAVWGNGGFETAQFTNFGTLIVRGGAGGESIDLIGIDHDGVLSAVTLDGDDTTNTDVSDDILQVESLPPGVTATLLGGADTSADQFMLDNLTTSTIDGIQGPVVVSPAGDEAGWDFLFLADFNDPNGDTIPVTSTTIEGITGFAGSPDVTYNTGDLIESIQVISSDWAADTFNIQSTMAGSTYSIDTGMFGAYDDVVNISSDAPTNTGTLDNIDGEINLDFGSGANTTLNVSDLGDTVGDTYTLTDVSGGLGMTELTFGDGAAAVDIRYNVSTTTLLANFNLVGSAATAAPPYNVYNINHTTGTASNTISDGNASNDSTFNIDIDGLQPGASSTFNGFDGNDTFNLDFTGGAVIPAGAVVQVNGGAPASSSANRDTVNLNIDGTRTATMTYASQVSGDLDVAGLGTAAEVLDLNTVELIRYNGDGADDDQLTVVGTSGDDKLTVAPVTPSGAVVFNGGNPFDGPPQDFTTQLPGVAGGSVAPDLAAAGLVNATGLTIQGGGATTADRLYVYGESQGGLTDPAALAAAYDPFGFGAGLILPAVGVPAAYDVITVTDTFTQVDGHVRVNYNATDFVQASPTVDPAIVVNAGRESTNAPLADNIMLTPSPAYRFQINGGYPDPVGTGIVPPDGDRLGVVSPGGVINVYSDKAGPPNVTIEFPGAGVLPFGYSSIESLFLDAGGGTVNLIGDNNNPGVDQNDNFVVLGRDVDGDPSDGGFEEFELVINGSAPILFDNVRFLNAYGDDSALTPSGSPDVDTLEITPYADDTPRGWGIDVSFDEGNPVQGDGAQADLLILHTSLMGGPVSEDIVIRPSGLEDGEIVVTNGSFGTPIVDIDYVNNLDIIVLDDDLFASDTDTLTLLGTNPDNPGTSGHELVTADFTAAGDVANPIVTVRDAAVAPPTNMLYRLRDFLGFDTITFELLDGDDAITLIGETNGANVAMDEINVRTGGGDDLVIVDVTGGLISGPITIDGGESSDTLLVTGNVPGPPVQQVEYIPGPDVTEGRLTYDLNWMDPQKDMIIDFVDLEPVIDLVPATVAVTVYGTNADNAINYTAGPHSGVVDAVFNPGGVNTGMVSVDAYETFEFAYKDDVLEILALAGDDVINVNNPTTPQDLDRLWVEGGDPTASDKLIVNAVPGVSDPMVVYPTGQGVGLVDRSTYGPSVDIDYMEIEDLTLVGQLADSAVFGDAFGVAGTPGNDLVEYMPGATPDTGTVVGTMDNGLFTLPTIQFSGMTQAAGMQFNQLIFGSQGGSDTLVLHGTAAADAIVYDGIDTVTNTVNGQLVSAVRIGSPLVGGSTTALVIEAAGGDDTVSVSPSTAVFVDVHGGQPDASDVVVFNGGGAAVTIDLAALTVTEFGFAPVSLTGAEEVNVNASGADVSVRGTPDDDDVTYSPTGAHAGQLKLAGLNTLFKLTSVGDLDIDALGGDNTLTANGTAGAEIIGVDGVLQTVTVGGLQAVNDYSNIDALIVKGHQGDDTFNVTPSATVPIFIDGGDPIGTTPGDQLNVNAGVNPLIFEPGPENDEGSFLVGTNERVSFDHIEGLGTIGGLPVVILGTNADDDITVIARDNSYDAAADGVQDFTVSVNAGPDLLFIGVPVLYIDALAGDDDIVVRTPAPNQADWNVNLYVAGGPPSASDRLVLETPGTDTVRYTPGGYMPPPVFNHTDFDTGLIVVDEPAGDSNISFGPFQVVLPGPTVFYTSSPGGIEELVYEGEGADSLTINGTAGDDATTFYPTGTGMGSFVAGLSPRLDFRGVTALTVNGGSGGFDVLSLVGTSGDDAVTSTATTVSLGGTATIGAGMDQLELSTLGGSDNIDLDLTVTGLRKVIDAGDGNDTVNLSGAQDATIFGGDGDDALTGTPLADFIDGGRGNDSIFALGGGDTVYGGEGDDAITGGTGTDDLFGGDGSDVFYWSEGDGSDLIEGDAGRDELLFVGATAAQQATEDFTLRSASSQFGSGVGDRVELLRTQGSVTLDMAGVETINIWGFSGNENVTVEDLYTTDVQVVNVDFEDVAGTDTETLLVEGRTVADNVEITIDTFGVTNLSIEGLRYDVNVWDTDPTNDTLTVDGNQGDDVIKAEDGVEALVAIVLNGGEGDDYLSADATLNGGAGNDFLQGGSGDDTLNGGAGDDTMVGGAGNDTFDGGGGFDTIVIEGTPDDDRIDVTQSGPTTLSYSYISPLGFVLSFEVDTLVAGSVEEARVEAGAGDDTIRVTHADGLRSTPQFSLRMNVHGGDPNASDRLVVVDDGLGDVVLHRLGPDDRSGTVAVNPANPVLAPLLVPTGVVVYEDIERVDITPVDPITGATGTDQQGRLVVFKYDPFESNDTLSSAYFLGSGAAINVDPTIDPGGDALWGLPGDNDFFQFVAAETGTLDFQVYFDEVAALGNGRPGLPGDGDLDVVIYDSDGLPVSIGSGTPLVDPAGNTIGERVAIPVVRNETYYMRVLGHTEDAVNIYNFTVINVPAPVPQLVDLTSATDSGRTDNDDVTNYDASINPAAEFDIILDDDRIDEFMNLDMLPDTNPDDAQTAGFDYGVEVFNNGVSIGFAHFVGGNTWHFTATAGDLQEGEFNWISAAVWLRDPADPEVIGRGELSDALNVILDTIAPPVTINGIDPAASDTGVIGYPATFDDRVTSDIATGFVGRAEADAIVRLYVDATFNNLNDNPAEFSLTVAEPLDGDEMFPAGQWQTAYIRDLNNPYPPDSFPFDGLREIVVTAEDLAGNVNLADDGVADADQVLEIFIDTQGPRVTDVFITAEPGYDLFDPKGGEIPVDDGPTPLVYELSIAVRDLPSRSNVDGNFLYPALEPHVAEDPGHYLLVGDANGVIPIAGVTFVPDPAMNGQPATGHVILSFFDPLPDDRFTLTLSDTLVDPVGNALDGESHAIEPHENPQFPSGDGQPGGDFVARFTVDSRPEIGVWSAGSVYVDTNGNSIFDPQNLDYTNRDITYTMGYASDDIFAGNFAMPGDDADGFDKLAAYGQNEAGFYRWLVDVDNDGVADINSPEPTGIVGTPVAGNFDVGDPNDPDDPGILNGDEVGLFDGQNWWLDGYTAARNFQVGDETPINNGLVGYPIVGDFDGDGREDLATFLNGVFTFDLAADGLGDIDDSFAVNFLDFIGVRDRPVAADMNQDDIDDIGLWVPDRSGAPPQEGGEWYFLVSGGDEFVVDGLPDTVLDRIVWVDGRRVVEFTPTPFGPDVYAQFGDEYAAPIVGNFDPPVAGSEQSDPSILTLEGTEGDDTLELVVDAAGTWTVAFNGVQWNVGFEVVTVEFDGLEGKDTVTLTGSSADEWVHLWPGHGTLSGDGYAATVTGVESVTVYGGSGTDVALLHDDPGGKDTFNAAPDAATLSGDGYSNQVVSFPYVHAYATVGNEDVALLHDDPNGSDTFEAWPTVARLYGDGFYNRVKSFRYVHAYATTGNKDVALLHDDPNGQDTFEAWPTMARLYGDGFYNRVKSFRYVHAYSTLGNTDVAKLYDSAGNDTFEAWPDVARLYGDGFYNRVKSFRYVHAYGTAGGTDVATLYGSDGNDTFVGTSRYSKLYGAEFYNRVVSFDQVHAYAGNGGTDVARLYDAVLEAGLAGQPAGAAVNSIAWLYDLERIYVHNDPDDGGDSVTDAVDEIFTVYWQ